MELISVSCILAKESFECTVVVATFGIVKYKLVCDSITTTGSLP